MSNPQPEAPPQGGPLAVPLPWDLVASGYVDENVAHFERYAGDALRLAELRPADVIADVATGPGTLALLASPLVARVEALDFSAVMLTELRARLAARGITNVGVQQGDGQVLPYADASFDKAFSMFGLMFFPDRARGFAELRRVLRVGGRALVSSWQSAARVPALLAVFEAMAAELPTLPQSSGKAPLSDPEEFRVEMSAAGFEVQVHEVIHAVEAESLERFWRGMRRSLAPLVLLEHKLGPEPFDALAKGIYRRLRERLGDGPLRMEMPAWLGVGRAV